MVKATYYSYGGWSLKYQLYKDMLNIMENEWERNHQLVVYSSTWANDAYTHVQYILLLSILTQSCLTFDYIQIKITFWVRKLSCAQWNCIKDQMTKLGKLR